MSRKSSLFLLLGICFVISVLLLLNVVGSGAGALLFAVSLALLGIFSRGYKGEHESKDHTA